jgi:hypothetical protein
MSGKAWTEDEIERLAQLWDAGLSIPEIATEMNRTASAIQSRIHRSSLSGATVSKDFARKCNRCQVSIRGLAAGLRVCDECRSRRCDKAYQSRPVNSAKKLIPCITCRTPFRSWGRGNRICETCKLTDEYRYA